jgi:chemotaxis protein MotA
MGLVLAIFVFLVVALSSVKDSIIFLDWHAAVIVLGGTLAAALLSFNITNITKLLKLFVHKVLKGTEDEYSDVIKEIVGLAAGYRTNDSFLEQKVSEIKHPFLKEGIQLILDGVFNEKEVNQLLTKRANTHYVRYAEEAHMFTTLAKFPPAFGLLGAVVGIIALMQGLGGAHAIKTVGSAMATALVATLYGIAVANFIFIPVGENLAKFNKQDRIIRKMVIDGIQMIREKKHPMLVEENLKCYLLPSERIKVKIDSDNSSSQEKKAA